VPYIDKCNMLMTSVVTLRESTHTCLSLTCYTLTHDKVKLLEVLDYGDINFEQTSNDVNKNILGQFE
jgi:hypothetical protein